MITAVALNGYVQSWTTTTTTTTTTTKMHSTMIRKGEKKKTRSVKHNLISEFFFIRCY